MPDVVIYGAGAAGATCRASLGPEVRVLCFADHEPARIGHEFDGLQVVHPSSLLHFSFDRVLLAEKDRAAALTFLLKLGVPLDKIDGSTPPVAQDTTPRPVAVVYGTGIEALRTLQYIEPQYTVACFCDPNPAMHGRHVAGRFVLAPSDLTLVPYDTVFIGSVDTYRAVHELLWQLRIPLEKMDVIPEHLLIRDAPAPPAARPRCVIFGAGASGQQVAQHLKSGHDIVAFVDNSPAKHGTTFCGRPVMPPAALSAIEHDRIVVASMFASEIFLQLSSMGFDNGNIVVVDPATIGSRPAPAARSFLKWLFKAA